MTTTKARTLTGKRVTFELFYAALSIIPVDDVYIIQVLVVETTILSRGQQSM